MSRAGTGRVDQGLRDEISQFYFEKGYYINQDTFNQCLVKIQPWINIAALTPYLMRHGILRNSSEMNQVNSNFFDDDTKLINLFRYTESNGGRDGFFVLYKCFCESKENVPLGHGDVVDELERYAAAHPVVPDWLEQSGEMSASWNPTSLSPQWNVGADEPGGQSLPDDSYQPVPTSSQAASHPQGAPSQQGRISTNLPLSVEETSGTFTDVTATLDGTGNPLHQTRRGTTPDTNDSPPTLLSQHDGRNSFLGGDAERDQPSGQGHGVIASDHTASGVSSMQYEARELRSPSMDTTTTSLSSFCGVDSAAFPEAKSVVSGPVCGNATVNLPVKGVSPASQHSLHSRPQSQATPLPSSQSIATKRPGSQSQTMPILLSQSQPPPHPLVQMIDLQPKDTKSSEFSHSGETLGPSLPSPLSMAESLDSLNLADRQSDDTVGSRAQVLDHKAVNEKHTDQEKGELAHSNQLIVVIKKLLASGDVHTLCTKYEESIELVPSEFCENKAAFMTFASRFICAVLNSRTQKLSPCGVLLGGVGFNEDKQVYEYKGVDLDEQECRHIVSRLAQVLCLTLKCSGVSMAHTLDVSSMIQAEIFTFQGVKTVILVGVTPKPEVCKEAVYYHRDDEASKYQCYSRENGKTYFVTKPHKIRELEKKLSNVRHSS